MFSLYLSIPEGYEYQPASLAKEKIDCFINKTNDAMIPIQHIVQSALQHKMKSAESYTDQGITVYYKYTPDNKDFFLRYRPNKNGRCASEDKNPTKVPGVICCRRTPQSAWWQFLSGDKKDTAMARRREQSDNRRKLGDCPAPN
jgi:hypothetical protein